MNPHSNILIWMHYIAATLVGLPASCGALYFGWQMVQILRRPTPPVPEMITNQGETVKLITGVERGLGMVLHPLASLGEGIIKGLFALSCCGLLLAAVLYFAGRGLSAGAGWARLLSGLAFSVMLCVGGLTLLTPATGLIRLASAAVFLTSGYGIWILVNGFKTAALR